MNWVEPARSGPSDARPESAFSLAHRALFEELGLKPNEYGHVLFSWFIFYLPDACDYLFGHVRSTLSSNQITTRVMQGAEDQGTEGAYEHTGGGSIDWIPYDSKHLDEIVKQARAGFDDPEAQDGEGRKWLVFAMWSANGLWRMGPLLKRRPEHYHSLTFA